MVQRPSEQHVREVAVAAGPGDQHPSTHGQQAAHLDLRDLLAAEGGASWSPAVDIGPARARRLVPGDRVGPYEVLQLLGEGGAAQVWEVRERATAPALRFLPLREVEKNYITEVVYAVRSKREASKVLGIAPSTLYEKLGRYGIQV